MIFRRNYLLLIALCLAGPVSLMLWWEFSFSPEAFNTEIEFPRIGETIHVRRVLLGMPDGDEMVFVTAGRKWGNDYDSTTDYLFTGGRIQYRKFKDTLELFVDRVSPVPPDFGSPIVIRQIYISQWVDDSILSKREKYHIRTIN